MRLGCWRVSWVVGLSHGCFASSVVVRWLWVVTEKPILPAWNSWSH